MKTVLIRNYTFDKAAKTVTFPDFDSIELANIVSIVDATNGNMIFCYKSPSYNGAVATNVLTLTYDTNKAAFNNSDKLIIEYINEGYSKIILPETNEITGPENTAILENYSKGVILFFDVTVLTAEVDLPSLIFSLEVQDPVTEDWIQVPGAITTALTAPGVKTLFIAPEITETANSRVSAILPRQYRIKQDLTGTGGLNATLSIGAKYIN